MVTDGGGGPIFVVGPAGSGTTLVRLILDSHDHIAIAQETGLARVLLANEQVPFKSTGGDWERIRGATPEERDRRMREFYGSLFVEFAAARDAVRWGDKTPFHLWHMALLARVFPDAVFVGVTRHPGAVAHSTRRRFGRPWELSLDMWERDIHQLLLAGSRFGDRFALCRFEDVVSSAEPTLRALFEWLGEPWSDDLLRFHEVHRRRGTAAEVEGATRSDAPINPERADAWVARMTPERWERLRRPYPSALAGVLGYRLGAGASGSWWEPLDGPLTTGTHMRERLRKAPAVSRTDRPRPSMPNRPLTGRDLQRLRRPNRAAAGRRSLVELVPLPLLDVGRRVMRRLPPGGRKRVRALLALTRR